MTHGQVYLLNLNEIVNFQEIIHKNKIDLGLYDKDIQYVNIDAKPRMKLHVVELTYFTIIDSSLSQEMEKLYQAFKK